MVYIAKTESLQFDILPENTHCEIEEEIGWNVAPLNFYKHTLGYITLDEMQDLLRRKVYEIPAIVTQPYISGKAEQDTISDKEPKELLKYIS